MMMDLLGLAGQLRALNVLQIVHEVLEILGDRVQLSRNVSLDQRY